MSDKSQQLPSASAAKPKVFKPRAGIVRKSKAERDEYARQEAERAAARAVAAEQANISSGATAAPRTERKSARDNKQRDNGRDQGAANGSGVFGAGTGSRPSRDRRVLDTGRAEMLEGQDAVKPEDGVKLSVEIGSGSGGGASGSGGGGGGGGGGGRTGLQRAGDEGLYEVDEEQDAEPKRDIERIWISSDEEEEAIVSSKGKSRAGTIKPSKISAGLRPVRAPRTRAEEQEETTTALRDVSKTAKSSQPVREDEEQRADDADDAVTVARETVLESSTAVKKDPPSSPELGRRRSVKKSVVKVKDPKLASETAEERAERLRLNDDIRKLKAEFAGPLKTKSRSTGEDVQMNDADGDTGTKLFLFQFPPLVPFLVDAEAIPPRPKSPNATIKKDPDGPESSRLSTAATSEMAAPAAPELPKTKMEGMLTADEPLRLSSGRVGKLLVHKSGKVSLDWGGTDMEIRHGTDVDFLQDIVLVDTPRSDAHETSVMEQPKQDGKAYALGQVQRKLVVIPDWQTLYD